MPGFRLRFTVVCCALTEKELSFGIEVLIIADDKTSVAAKKSTASFFICFKVFGETAPIACLFSDVRVQIFNDIFC